MGGIGSGRQKSGTLTTYEVKRIDIGYLKKSGILNSHRSGKLTWSRNGEQTGFINYTNTASSLILQYRYRQFGEDWQPVEQTIRYTKTNCHYGGFRTWFVCPKCSRQCGILYSAGPLFLCRVCYRLPYETQIVGMTERLILKLHKLGRRIFDETGYRKAKGMHWKTFELLLDRYHNLDERIDIRILGCCQLIERNFHTFTR